MHAFTPTFPIRRALRCCAAVLMLVSGAIDAKSVTPLPADAVTVVPDGSAYSVDADFLVAAPAELVFAVFSDYEHMTNFLPGLKSSEVMNRHGNTVRVRQVSTVHVAFVAFDVESVREIVLDAPWRIAAKGIAGDFKSMESSVVLTASGDGTRVHYHARSEPTLKLPAGIAQSFARQLAADQLSAMVDEVGRRAHPAGPTSMDR